MFVFITFVGTLVFKSHLRWPVASEKHMASEIEREREGERGKERVYGSISHFEYMLFHFHFADDELN